MKAYDNRNSYKSSRLHVFWSILTDPSIRTPLGLQQYPISSLQDTANCYPKNLLESFWKMPL